MQPEPDKIVQFTVNKRARNNQRIFAISLIVFQAVLSAMYGIFCQAPIQIINLGSILTAIFFAFLVVGGFGLYFSYYKSLLWNGIGFSLFITALSIQLYPLVNALWAKMSIHSNTASPKSFGQKNFNIYLGTHDSINFQSNAITSSIKCALALIVSFGSAIGRVGPLECFIMSVLGVFIYELNRNFIAKFGQDVFGTFTVFTFGGFLGLTYGIFLRMREGKKRVRTTNHERLDGNSESIAHAIFGGILIFVLFPFLAFEGDQSYVSNLFQRYTAPVSIILSMASAILTSIGLGMLVHGDGMQGIRIKDILNALVAGGIANGAASFYITTPFLAIVIAITASVLQYFFDNFVEKRLYRITGLLSTYSFTVFCLQGLVGAAFAAGYSSKLTANSSKDGFTFSSDSLHGPANEIIIYFISAGMGIGCGILSGIPCYCINKYKTDDMFHDRVEFKPDDCIFYSTARVNPSLIVKGPIPKPDPVQEVIGGKNQDKTEEKPEPVQPIQPNEQQFQQQAPSSIDEISFDFVDMLQVAIE